MANPPCENADANDILERPVASLHHNTNIYIFFIMYARKIL
jgi:hypothetical protein